MDIDTPDLNGYGAEELQRVMFRAKQQMIHLMVETDPKQESKRWALQKAIAAVDDVVVWLEKSR